jgi:hypothetical protein
VPKIVTILGASVPLSVIGAILFTTGAVTLRVSAPAHPKEPETV